MQMQIFSNLTIKQLESERAVLAREIRRYVFSFIGSVAGLGYCIYSIARGNLSSFDQWIAIGFGIAFVVAIFVLIDRWIKADRTFTRKIKKQAIETVFDLEGLDWEYEPRDLISEHVFERSRLFSTTPNSFLGGDWISGTYGSIPFESCYLNCTRHQGKSRQTIFRGLFISLRLQNNIEDTTVILPDTAQRVFGESFGKKMQSLNTHRKMKLVYFEQEDKFEQQFVVYSNSEASARQALDQRMIQQIMALNQTYPDKFQISIQPNEINIAANYGTYFNLTKGKSLTDEQNWKGVFKDISNLKDTITRFGNIFVA